MGRVHQQTTLAPSGAAVLVAAVLVASVAWASGEPHCTVVIDNLDNPCGLAIQPGTGHLFVACHGSIHRLVMGENGAAASVAVAGFPTDIYGKGPKYNISALGLGFMNQGATLVAGGGELVDGEEVVRFFKVGTDPKESLKFSDAFALSGPIKGEDSPKGEGNYYGVAISENQVFVTCNGDDTKGWIAKIEVKDGKPGPLTPFIKSKVETNVDAPTGVTICPKGMLVVTQLGEINVPGDSLLTVYNPESGKLEGKAASGLHDLTGVAFHPKSHTLYAVDFAWMAPDQGGLYRIDMDGDKVKTTKVLSLEKPTSMAFAADGTLYVACIVSDAKKGDKSPGKVVKITGLN